MDDERDIRLCEACEKEVERSEMDFTSDCHGVPFRLVCHDCWKRLMAKGYDGQYYEDTDDADAMLGWE